MTIRTRSEASYTDAHAPSPRKMTCNGSADDWTNSEAGQKSIHEDCEREIAFLLITKRVGRHALDRILHHRPKRSGKHASDEQGSETIRKRLRDDEAKEEKVKQQEAGPNPKMLQQGYAQQGRKRRAGVPGGNWPVVVWEAVVADAEAAEDALSRARDGGGVDAHDETHVASRNGDDPFFARGPVEGVVGIVGAVPRHEKVLTIEVDLFLCHQIWHATTACGVYNCCYKI